MVESLILGGAFDNFGHHRSQYIAVYEDLMRRIAGMEKQKSGAQLSLFGSLIQEETPKADYPNIPEWGTEELLAKEKSVLGVYVSGHPFEQYAPYFTDCTFHCGMLSDYEEDEETGDRTYSQIESGQQITFGGLIAGIKKVNTRAGATMAFVTVEDLYGNIDCVAFPKVYERAKPYLRADGVVRVFGKIDISPDKAPVIIVDKFEAFQQPEEREESVRETAKQEVLWLDARQLSEEDFSELIEMLGDYAGNVPVKVLHGGKRYEYAVNPTRGLWAELHAFLPDSGIKLV